MGTPLLFFFFFLLFMRLFLEIDGGIQYDECKASRCSHHGPVIQFPFRLKDQPVPDHCGYPGFELTCSEEKRTILELPNSAKLWVKEIDYTSQEMFVRYPDDKYCLQWRIVNLNLSALPFQFTDSTPFSFFNCSENKSESYGFLGSIPCTCSSSDPVYFTRSPKYLSEVDLTSCRKIFNATIPEFILYDVYDAFSMIWSKPMCRYCEAGEKCQLKKKSNSREPEIECIPKPAKGTSPCKLLMKFSVVVVMYAPFVLINFTRYCTTK